ncbi:hypothetical protein ABPG75_001162 [Micractinium tetrahymenae]
MGRAYTPPHSKLGLLLRCGALLAGVWLLLTLAARSGAWPGGSGGAAENEADDLASYGGWGFATLGSSGTRRQLQPHEMCSWETALESSMFDRVVDKEGWPTKFEQLVSESQPIAPVFCPVCGAAQQSIKFSGMNVREEGRCPRCSGFNRLRQIAEAALPEVWRMTGRNFRSLNELALSDLSIYHTQCSGVLHNMLSSAMGYVCSEFVSAELAPGTVVRGVRHEDLQRTSFADNTFDLVISSEMMSRVASPYQAHYEVKRILKPGGSHVFTVPFSPSDYHDDIRASVEEGRLVHHVEPPIYTGDSLHPKGVLLFTIFGKEMVDKVCMLGYNVTAHHLHHGAHGIIGNNAWVFITTKP